MSRRTSGVAAAWLGLSLMLVAGGADGPTSASSDKKALSALQAYVGEWRGVGQLKRGSSQGAWTEESEWAWHFEKGRGEMLGQLVGDKYYAQLQLQAGEKPGQFVLLATSAAPGNEDARPATEQFSGGMVGGALVLAAKEPKEDRPARVSVRLVAGGDRMLVLYEKRLGETYTRLAEVGSTRKGSSFAQSVVSGPECVVTGGLGKIMVEHKGRKYYVCCTGCRDLFLDDPEAVLEEYHQRKVAERAEKNK